MKLTYRGATYQMTDSAVEVCDDRVGGLYRGASWKLLRVTKVPYPQPTHELTYRGIAYGAVTVNEERKGAVFSEAIAASL